MANVTNIRAAAVRIRAVAESLADPKDAALVRDYITELELLAARQEAEDARRNGGSQH